MIDREHRNQNIKMRCMFDVSTSRIGSRFGDDLANRSLHFILDPTGL
jgi:hypothetical protein